MVVTMMDARTTIECGRSQLDGLAVRQAFSRSLRVFASRSANVRDKIAQDVQNTNRSKTRGNFWRGCVIYTVEHTRGNFCTRFLTRICSFSADRQTKQVCSDQSDSKRIPVWFWKNPISFLNSWRTTHSCVRALPGEDHSRHSSRTIFASDTSFERGESYNRRHVGRRES